MTLDKTTSLALGKEKHKLLLKINKLTRQYVDIVNELDRRDNALD